MREGSNVGGLKKGFAAFLAAVFLFSTLTDAWAQANVWEERRQVRAASGAGAFADASSALSSLPVLRATKDLPADVPDAAEPLLKPLQGSPFLKYLPLSNTSVREAYFPRGGFDRLIIHLQDIHGQKEAQDNIGRAVQWIEAESRRRGAGPALVAVEGASGPFLTDSYRAFPTPEALQDVSGLFYKKGLLTGVEYAALTGPTAPTLWGIEDPDLYRKHVEAVKAGFTREAPLRQSLADLESRLAGLKESSYPPALKAWDRRFLDHHAGRLPLGEYVRFLAASAPEGNRPNVRRFLAAIFREESMDFPKAEAERKALVQGLSSRLSAPALESLAEAAAAFRLGRLGFARFNERLSSAAGAAGLSLASFPAFSAYVGYVKDVEKIDRARLLEEIDALEGDAAARALAGAAPEVRRTYEASQDMVLALKLVNRTMTPADWARYAPRRETVRDLPARLGARDGSFAGDLALFEDFYTLAEDRSRALVSRLMEKAGPEGGKNAPSVAVLLTGGFHTDGMTRLLRERGAAYVVLSPRIEKVGDQNYLDVFREDKTPLERLFEGEKVTIVKELGTARRPPFPDKLNLTLTSLLVAETIRLSAETVAESDLIHWDAAPLRSLREHVDQHLAGTGLYASLSLVKEKGSWVLVVAAKDDQGRPVETAHYRNLGSERSGPNVVLGFRIEKGAAKSFRALSAFLAGLPARIRSAVSRWSGKWVVPTRAVFLGLGAAGLLVTGAFFGPTIVAFLPAAGSALLAGLAGGSLPLISFLIAAGAAAGLILYGRRHPGTARPALSFSISLASMSLTAFVITLLPGAWLDFSRFFLLSFGALVLTSLSLIGGHALAGSFSVRLRDDSGDVSDLLMEEFPGFSAPVREGKSLVFERLDGVRVRVLELERIGDAVRYSAEVFEGGAMLREGTFSLPAKSHFGRMGDVLMEIAEGTFPGFVAGVADTDRPTNPAGYPVFKAPEPAAVPSPRVPAAEAVSTPLPAPAPVPAARPTILPPSGDEGPSARPTLTIDDLHRAAAAPPLEEPLPESVEAKVVQLIEKQVHDIIRRLLFSGGGEEDKRNGFVVMEKIRVGGEDGLSLVLDLGAITAWVDADVREKARRSWLKKRDQEARKTPSGRSPAGEPPPSTRTKSGTAPRLAPGMEAETESQTADLAKKSVIALFLFLGVSRSDSLTLSPADAGPRERQTVSAVAPGLAAPPVFSSPGRSSGQISLSPSPSRQPGKGGPGPLSGGVGPLGASLGTVLSGRRPGTEGRVLLLRAAAVFAAGLALSFVWTGLQVPDGARVPVLLVKGALTLLLGAGAFWFDGRLRAGPKRISAPPPLPARLPPPLPAAKKEPIAEDLTDVAEPLPFLPPIEGLEVGASVGFGTVAEVEAATWHGQPAVMKGPKSLKNLKRDLILAEHEQESLVRLEKYPRLHGRVPGVFLRHEAFLVISLLPGRTILDIVRTPGEKVDQAVVLAWFESLLQLLEDVHREEVHGDLNLKNILIDEKGNAYLLDFAGSRLIGARLEDSPHSYVTFSEYSPPQALTAGVPAAASDDLFTAGALIFRLLTKVRPPKDLPPATTPGTLLGVARWRQEVLSDDGKDLGIPENLRRLLKKATSLDPEERFQTPAEMSLALQQARLRGEPSIRVHGEPSVETEADFADLSREDSSTIAAAALTTIKVQPPAALHPPFAPVEAARRAFQPLSKVSDAVAEAVLPAVRALEAAVDTPVLSPAAATEGTAGSVLFGALRHGLTFRRGTAEYDLKIFGLHVEEEVGPAGSLFWVWRDFDGPNAVPVAVFERTPGDISGESRARLLEIIERRESLGLRVHAGETHDIPLDAEAALAAPEAPLPEAVAPAPAAAAPAPAGEALFGRIRKDVLVSGNAATYGLTMLGVSVDEEIGADGSTFYVHALEAASAAPPLAVFHRRTSEVTDSGRDHILEIIDRRMDHGLRTDEGETGDIPVSDEGLLASLSGAPSLAAAAAEAASAVVEAAAGVSRGSDGTGGTVIKVDFAARRAERESSRGEKIFGGEWRKGPDGRFTARLEGTSFILEEERGLKEGSSIFTAVQGEGHSVRTMGFIVLPGESVPVSDILSALDWWANQDSGPAYVDLDDRRELDAFLAAARRAEEFNPDFPFAADAWEEFLLDEGQDLESAVARIPPVPADSSSRGERLFGGKWGPRQGGGFLGVLGGMPFMLAESLPDENGDVWFGVNAGGSNVRVMTFPVSSRDRVDVQGLLGAMVWWVRRGGTPVRADLTSTRARRQFERLGRLAGPGAEGARAGISSLADAAWKKMLDSRGIREEAPSQPQGPGADVIDFATARLRASLPLAPHRIISVDAPDALTRVSLSAGSPAGERLFGPSSSLPRELVWTQRYSLGGETRYAREGKGYFILERNLADGRVRFEARTSVLDDEPLAALEVEDGGLVDAEAMLAGFNAAAYDFGIKTAAPASAGAVASSPTPAGEEWSPGEKLASGRRFTVGKDGVGVLSPKNRPYELRERRGPSASLLEVYAKDYVLNGKTVVNPLAGSLVASFLIPNGHDVTHTEAMDFAVVAHRRSEREARAEPLRIPNFRALSILVEKYMRESPEDGLKLFGRDWRERFGRPGVVTFDAEGLPYRVERRQEEGYAVFRAFAGDGRLIGFMKLFPGDSAAMDPEDLKAVLSARAHNGFSAEKFQDETITPFTLRSLAEAARNEKAVRAADTLRPAKAAEAGPARSVRLGRDSGPRGGLSQLAVAAVFFLVSFGGTVGLGAHTRLGQWAQAALAPRPPEIALSAPAPAPAHALPLLLAPPAVPLPAAPLRASVSAPSDTLVASVEKRAAEPSEAPRVAKKVKKPVVVVASVVNNSPFPEDAAPPAQARTARRGDDPYGLNYKPPSASSQGPDRDKEAARPSDAKSPDVAVIASPDAAPGKSASASPSVEEEPKPVVSASAAGKAPAAEPPSPAAGAITASASPSDDPIFAVRADPLPASSLAPNGKKDSGSRDKAPPPVSSAVPADAGPLNPPAGDLGPALGPLAVGGLRAGGSWSQKYGYKRFAAAATESLALGALSGALFWALHSLLPPGWRELSGLVFLVAYPGAFNIFHEKADRKSGDVQKLTWAKVLVVALVSLFSAAGASPLSWPMLLPALGVLAITVWHQKINGDATAKEGADRKTLSTLKAAASRASSGPLSRIQADMDAMPVRRLTPLFEEGLVDALSTEDVRSLDDLSSTASLFDRLNGLSRLQSDPAAVEGAESVEAVREALQGQLQGTLGRAAAGPPALFRARKGVLSLVLASSQSFVEGVNVRMPRVPGRRQPSLSLNSRGIARFIQAFSWAGAWRRAESENLSRPTAVVFHVSPDLLARIAKGDAPVLAQMKSWTEKAARARRAGNENLLLEIESEDASVRGKVLNVLAGRGVPTAGIKVRALTEALMRNGRWSEGLLKDEINKGRPGLVPVSDVYVVTPEPDRWSGDNIIPALARTLQDLVEKAKALELVSTNA